MTFIELDHTAEGHLWLTDRAAWVVYKAAHWRWRMEGRTEAEKRAAWETIPESVKDELRRTK